jgi:hypothetical protein
MKLDVFIGMGACALASSALASVNFPEIEPNNSKAQATLISGMRAGDAILGVSSSASGSGLDYFRVRTAPSDTGLGIFRHRLVLTSSISGQVGTIRGLNQSEGAIGGSDFTMQSSSGGTQPPFFNQWYGFGTQADLYYRVVGTPETTQPYAATLETVAVTPTSLGTFQQGMLTITTVGQGHFNDTELWVYDQNFNPLPGFGNDNAPLQPGQTGLVTQSSLTRMFTAGVYYLALSDANFANNLASPEDDTNRNGVVLDFAGSAANSSAISGLNLSFAIGTAGEALTPFAAVKQGAYDINWYRFQVVPTPGGACLLALGAVGAVRRRR